MLNDYRVIYRPDHPSSMKSENWKGWVYEHTYVIEKLLGRTLGKDEQVHHLNLDRSDNQPSNLIVLSPADHGKLHAWMRNGAPGLETASVNALNSGKPKANAKKQESKVKEPRLIKICEYCSEPILSSGNIKYCSAKCAYQASRRVERPTADELQDMVWKLPTTSIAKNYGVSDKTIEKWCKAYGIVKPPRGYWQKQRQS